MPAHALERSYLDRMSPGTMESLASSAICPAHSGELHDSANMGA